MKKEAPTNTSNYHPFSLTITFLKKDGSEEKLDQEPTTLVASQTVNPVPPPPTFLVTSDSGDRTVMFRGHFPVPDDGARVLLTFTTDQPCILQPLHLQCDSSSLQAIPFRGFSQQGLFCFL